MGRAAGAIVVFAPSPSMTSAPVPRRDLRA